MDISYWISVLNAIETNSVLPDPNLFILPLQDKGVNTQRVSLKPNPIRKTLFQGKTFVFFSETMCREYKKMIKDAGMYYSFIVNLYFFCVIHIIFKYII